MQSLRATKESYLPAGSDQPQKTPFYVQAVARHKRLLSARRQWPATNHEPTVLGSDIFAAYHPLASNLAACRVVRRAYRP